MARTKKQYRGLNPPERLKLAARRKWLDTFTDLQPASPMDVELACQYCEQYALYLTAKQTSEREGIVATAGKNGAPYAHPAVGVMNKAQERMEAIYKLLSPKLSKPTADEFLDGLR